jgi:hypothetical protein
MDLTKSEKRVGTRYAELVFFIRWDMRVTQRILVRPAHETSTHYFSCSGGPSVVSIKSAPGHVTVNLCFSIQWHLQVT